MLTSGPLSAPHAHAVTSVPRVMLTVWAALLPASLYSIYLFGWPALNLYLITVASALAFEALGVRLLGKPVRPFVGDGSALLTAWLLAMAIPPWAPWWLAVLGGFLAIIVGKQVFGGIGQNLFNPAMVARIALLISFPIEMTAWVNPQPLFSAAAPGFLDGLAITFGHGMAQFDAVSGATTLSHIKTELTRGVMLDTSLAEHGLWQSVLGATTGSLGETSAILILLGGLYLLWKRIITWHIPVAVLGSVFLLATVFHLLDPLRYAGPLVHLTSGALILGAFFIATDPVGSPSSALGQLLFGAGIGLLTYVIRTWGGFPEGLGFAVLIMNAVTPLIDHYLRPRIYGRQSDGSPIEYGEEQA